MNHEIDVTDFFTTASPRDYSASAAELGQDAGRITWGHACQDAADYPHLDTEEKREAGLDTEAPDWAEYQAGAEAGQYSGRLFCGDDGRIYYYIGN